MKQLLALAFVVTISFSQWKQVNGPDGGVVMAFAGSGDSVFAGTKGGGIFRTTNGGTSWKMVNNGITNFDIEALAVKDSIVYAGGYGYASGFFVSTNFGDSWVDKSAAFESKAVKSIAVFDSVVLVGTNGYGLFRSSDAGSSWKKIDSGFTTTVGASLIYHNGIFYAGTNIGVFLSTDKGISWTKRTSDLGKINIQALVAKDSMLFAGTNSAIYLSVDSGATWINKTGSLPYSVIYSLGFKENLLLAGTNASVCYSPDFGKTWGTPITNNGMSGYTVTPAIFVSGKKVFAATMNDVYVSTNNGINWAARNTGINAISIIGLYSDDKFILAANGNYGIRKSTNNGLTWAKSDSGYTNAARSFFKGTSTLLVAGPNGGIFYSLNSGSKWNVAAVNPTANYIVSGWTKIGGTLYFSENGKGIFKSTDDGKTWSTPLADNSLNKSVWSVTSLDTVLYAGTSTGVYKSTNGGANWFAMNGGNTTIANSIIPAITSINGKIFAATYSYGVFYSTNNGATWKTTGTGLTGSVSSFYQNGNLLFAVTEKEGVLAYKDSTWKSFNTGLMNKSIGSVVFVGDTIFASTLGMGIWKRSISDVATSVMNNLSSTPQDFALEQNYPNPFNPSTNIRFEVRELGQTTLKVYDIVGREVTTLVNENLNAGKYEVRFDASKFSTGIYLYQLRSGNFVETKKMILIK